jgi:predicted O-linked N-acetylglucosamine transferase (SPINDLY family)
LQPTQSAAQLMPGEASAHYNLGKTLNELQRHAEAEASLRLALRLDSQLTPAHYQLGLSLHAQGQATEAEHRYRTALLLDPDDAQAHNNLGITLNDQSRRDEAEGCFRRALQLDPAFEDACSNLLFVLNYHPDQSAEDIYQAYADYERQFAAPLRREWPRLERAAAAGRRLRIGYVSPDFRQHSARHFLEPLLERHDRTRFEIFAYAELAREDAVTQRYRGHCDHFILTRGMSDEALAARIRADAIDVLVDVAGHTSGNRLLTFARKPAPVSLSWMGYGYTTGLKAIDYLLTDEASAPAGSEHLFSEVPWRLPEAAYVYRPDAAMGEVSALPALDNGCVTFGTLTRAIRINHRTVRVWAQILARVPGSRLVIDSRNFQQAPAQEAMAARFAAHGIARERLLIGCHSPPWDTLRAIDIGLDCFPHNSGTTLFETLYMGVPYLTLAGRPSVGRLGKSILHGLGRPEWLQAWCADSEQDYIDKAVALAHDLPALARIRAELRPQMQRSALMDEAGFARRVEDACTQMFALWQAEHSNTTATQENAP